MKMSMMKDSNSISTREASAIQEVRVAKKLGGTVNPNSGAGLWKKGDVQIPEASMLIECKTCMKPKDSFSIKKEWIEKDKKELFSNRLYHHIIAFNFNYSDTKDYYVIDDKLAEFLISKLIEEYK